jgi:hypothetical protein
MRTSIATLTVASLILSFGVASAQAAPSEVDVRVEGASETLFEGPLLTEGHDVQSASGTKEDTEEHPCDGTNNKAHMSPGPTPTAAAVDAMSIIGETFAGRWYPGFDDYFITRWGPEKEEKGMSWGLVVNNVFTDVGGCQYELSKGAEVLWIYNAFTTRPILALLPESVGYTSGPRPLTATAELNKPFTVEVLAYKDKEEDEPPAGPERAGAEPYSGAKVSPVETNAAGFEKLDTASPEAVSTNAEGKASITFTKSGWHRIKATVLNEAGEEDAIRSNRIDVCVPAEGDSGCGAIPEEDQVRVPARTEAERRHEEELKVEEEARRQGEEAKREEEERKLTEQVKLQEAEEIKRQEEAKKREAEGKAEVLGFKAAQPESVLTSPVRVQAPTFDGQGAVQGLVGVGWQILEPGVGLKSWTITSKVLGVAGAPDVTRATGSSTTSALLTLPSGLAYEIEVTFTDVLGRSSTMQVGKVLVPRDDRWSGLHYTGRWRHLKQVGAWLGTVSRAGAGARVSVKLGPGRPVFLMRGTSSTARVEVRAGSDREMFTVPRGSSSSSKLLTAESRARAGTVTLRVLTGTVDLDGVALES